MIPVRRFPRAAALSVLCFSLSTPAFACETMADGMQMGDDCPGKTKEAPPAPGNPDRGGVATGENGKTTPEAVQRILLNIRAGLLKDYPESAQLLKPDFDQLLNASRDPKNIAGITPEFYTNLKQVLILDVKRERLQNLQREQGLTAEQKQELAKLEEVYSSGEEMKKIMTVGLGEVYMKIDQDNGSFGKLPPDLQRGHNSNWSAEPGAGAAPWNFSGQTELNLGNPSGAKSAFEKALSLDPRNTTALVGRGVANEKLGDYAGAYRDAQAALRIEPGNMNALTLAKFNEGRSAPAGSLETPSAASNGGGWPAGGGSAGSAGGLAASNAAVSRLNAEQALRAAQSALGLNDMGGALTFANRALALDTNNPALLNLRASIYARMREYAKATADARSGLALLPKNAALLRTKAYAELRGGNYQDALNSSNQLIALDPKDAYAFALRGHAAGSLGNRDAMLADINRAAQLDARFGPAAELAGTLQLPVEGDVLFLFPGEAGARAAARSAAPANRGRRFGFMIGVSALGGLLLALGLLQTVLAPLKSRVTSAFTRMTRTGPSVGALATAQPASVGGHMPGLIRGQYEIQRQIGQGGMGTVFEGVDRSLGRKVAIKKMRDELRINPQERARFVIEAKTVAALHHPNIVDIYAIGEDGDDVYLVFEFVDGKTVHDLVQRSGRLAIRDAARVVRAAADALGYAHSRGVVHRDMKPSNMMIDSAGRVKVMDFGIARMAKDALTRYSMTNTVVGTPPYMAPEQEQGQVRRESDVYSLAVCAYEMLTGKLPFIGIGAGMLMNKINMSYIAPSHAIAGLPENLDAVFAKAFQAVPENRYRTPREFADALESALPSAARA